MANPILKLVSEPKRSSTPKVLTSLALATVQFGFTTASFAQQSTDQPNPDQGKPLTIQRSPNLDSPCSIADPAKVTASTSDSHQAMLATIADQLCKANLLTSKAYKAIKTAIKKGELSTRAELLNQVYTDAFLKELGVEYTTGNTITLFGEKVHLSNLFVQTKIEIIGDENEQKIEIEKSIQNRQELLNQLQATGILSDRVYNNLKQGVVTDQIQLDTQLLSRAALEMSLDEQLESLQFNSLLQRLQEVAVISAPERQSIYQAIEKGEINNSIEILNYINRAIVIDLKKLSPDVNQYFLAGHQAIAALLKRNQIADISLNNFKVNIVEDKENSELMQLLYDEAAKVRKDLKPYISYNAIVKVTDQNRTYQQSGFYAKPDTPDDFLGRLDEEEIINLFNKILRDRQSAYRLYPLEATSYDLGILASDNSRFGVIALTETQAKAIGWSEMLQLRQQSHDNSLTSKKIDQWLQLFEQIGLLSHLTPAQIATSRQSIQQSYISSPDELLAAFDHLLVTFNWESGNIDNPYQALTEEFATASRGAFTPTQITNEFDMDQRKAGQSFVWQGKQYKIKLKFNGDWLDPEFFDFIETLFTQTVPNGKLYNISAIGGEGTYIFLTDAQHQALVSAGVLE